MILFYLYFLLDIRVKRHKYITLYYIMSNSILFPMPTEKFVNQMKLINPNNQVELEIDEGKIKFFPLYDIDYDIFSQFSKLMKSNNNKKFKNCVNNFLKKNNMNYFIDEIYIDLYNIEIE